MDSTTSYLLIHTIYVHRIQVCVCHKSNDTQHVNYFVLSMCTITVWRELWRVQTLVKWQGKHHWQNKLWRIDDESLIKCILKQFEYTSAPNLSIHAHVCACRLNDVRSRVR